MFGKEDSHMKKIVSLLLCMTILFSTAFCLPTGALTVDYGVESAEDAALTGNAAVRPAAASLAQTGVVSPVSAHAYGHVTENVDPRYPGAYYTFADVIDTDTLTLANIGVDGVSSFDYDEETNTVVLFKDVSANAPGAALSFAGHTSDVRTINGDAVAFTPLAYTLSSSFPNTGDNLIPYGDMEHGYLPLLHGEGLYPYTIVETEDGGHAAFMNSSAYTRSSVKYPRYEAYLDFKDGYTYKFSFRLKNHGLSKPAVSDRFIGSVTGKASGPHPFTLIAGASFTGTQTGASDNAGGTNKLFNAEDQKVSVPDNGDWSGTYTFELTVGENTKKQSPESFFFYSSCYTAKETYDTVDAQGNPTEATATFRYLPSFYADDVSAYQRLDVVYGAGADCVLKDGEEEPSRTVGFYADEAPADTTVPAAREMPYEALDDRYHVDPAYPWQDEDGNLYAAGGPIDLAALNKTVYLTPHLVTDLQIFTVSFDCTGLTKQIPDMKVFEGDEVDLSLLNVSAVSGKRFNGWMLTPDGGIFDTISSVKPKADMTVYARVNYDFDFAFAQNNDGWSPGYATIGQKQYLGNSLLVCANGNGKDVMLRQSGLSIPAGVIRAVVVYLDADYAGEDQTNLFREGFETDGIYWVSPPSTDYSSAKHTKASVSQIIEAEGRRYAVVRYDVTKSEGWNGVVSALRFDPFNEISDFVVRAIVFEFSDIIDTDTVVFKGAQTPEVGRFENMTLTETSGVSDIASYVWIPALIDGKFAEKTAYRLRVTFMPHAGKRFGDDMKIRLGDTSIDAAYNRDGSISGTFDMGKTDAYVDFEFAVDGPTCIAKAGRVTPYKAVIREPLVYDKSVVWSVSDPDIAEIDPETGRLLPIRNGTVIVTAVSNYNPTVSASLAVEITNQEPLKIVHYDSNTDDDVFGMPDDEEAVGYHELSKQIPVREGYFFLGWAENAESMTTVEAVTVAADVTVYAVWCRGYLWRFGTEGDLHPSPTSLAPDTALVETEDYAEFAPKSNNVRFPLNFYEGIDPDRYRKVLVRMATDTAVASSIYYKSRYRNANGDLVKIGYDENDYNDAEAQVMKLETKALGLDTFYTMEFDLYGTPSKGTTPGTWYQGEAEDVIGVYVDPYKSAGSTFRISYIAVLDSLRTVTFRANTDDEVRYMPEAREVGQGETITIRTAPQRDGYAFVGWRRQPDGETKTTFTVVDDLVLTAVWDKVIDVRNEEQNGKTVASLGTLDPSGGRALYVSLLTREKDVNITLDAAEGTLYASTNGNGAVVFPIEKTLSDAVLSVKGASFGDVRQMRPDAAYALRDKVDASGAKIRTSDTGPKIYDTEVTVVESDKEKYDPSLAGESADDGYLSPLMRSGKEGDVLFNFDDTREASLFNAAYQMESTGIADSLISYRALGKKYGSEDSPSITTSKLALNADTHRYVVIKVKQASLASNDLRLYFRKDGAALFAEARAENAQMSERYDMLVYDMASFDDWTGVIDALMLSLDGDVTGTVEIDWLLFTDNVPASMDEIVGTPERFPVVRTGDLPFADVASSAWYRGEVEQAWKMGLVNGKSENTYEPNSPVTVAETVALAVRLHTVFTLGDSVAENADGAWYDPYIEAALRSGIIAEGEYADYDAPALRKNVACIMAKAVPDDYLKAINVFTSVPDVSRRDGAFSAVRKLYNAGIVTGSDAQHDFLPDTNITRAEMAAIVCRIAVPSARKRVVTDAEKETLKLRFSGDDLANAVLDNCASDKFDIKNGVARSVSASADPIVFLTNAIPEDFNGKAFSKMVVGMTWDTAKAPDPVKAGCALYFTTPGSGWSQKRRIDPVWNGAYKDGVGEIVFDLTSNAAFADFITGLRLKPFNVKDADFGIAYIIFEP